LTDGLGDNAARCRLPAERRDPFTPGVAVKSVCSIRAIVSHISYLAHHIPVV